LDKPIPQSAGIGATWRSSWAACGGVHGADRARPDGVQGPRDAERSEAY
jgi:hypothetical protein